MASSIETSISRQDSKLKGNPTPRCILEYSLYARDSTRSQERCFQTEGQVYYSPFLSLNNDLYEKSLLPSNLAPVHFAIAASFQDLYQTAFQSILYRTKVQSKSGLSTNILKGKTDENPRESILAVAILFQLLRYHDEDGRRESQIKNTVLSLLAPFEGFQMVS